MVLAVGGDPLDHRALDGHRAEHGQQRPHARGVVLKLRWVNSRWKPTVMPSPVSDVGDRAARPGRASAGSRPTPAIPRPRARPAARRRPASARRAPTSRARSGPSRTSARRFAPSARRESIGTRRPPREWEPQRSGRAARSAGRLHDDCPLMNHATRRVKTTRGAGGLRRRRGVGSAERAEPWAARRVATCVPDGRSSPDGKPRLGRHAPPPPRPRALGRGHRRASPRWRWPPAPAAGTTSGTGARPGPTRWTSSPPRWR